MRTRSRLQAVESSPEPAVDRKPGSRYLVSKSKAIDLVDRVLASPPGVVKLTIEEMRMWRDHVVIIHG